MPRARQTAKEETMDNHQERQALQPPEGSEIRIYYEGNDEGLPVADPALFEKIKAGEVTKTNQFIFTIQPCDLTGAKTIMPEVWKDGEGKEYHLHKEVSRAIGTGAYWLGTPREEAVKEAERTATVRFAKQESASAQAAAPGEETSAREIPVAENERSSRETAEAAAEEKASSDAADEQARPYRKGKKGYKKRDVYKETTDKIISMLESGSMPWQKAWDEKAAGLIVSTPLNGKNNRPYTRWNRLYLSMLMEERGTDDPRFFTMGTLKHQNKIHQAKVEMWKAQGKDYKPEFEWEYRVKEGTRSIGIISTWKVDTDKYGNPLPEEDQYFANKNTSVYHASDCIRREYERDKDGNLVRDEEGRIKYTDHPLIPWEPKHKGYTHEEQSEICEAILKASGAKIIHDVPRLHEYPCYAPSSDTIHLPPKEAFPDINQYYATALHELGHWTGHETRLDRPLASMQSDKESYAKEELRAELASTFLAVDLGLPMNPTNHAAYIGSWIKALKDDKMEIFKASNDAKKIADFVKSFMPERFREKDAALVEAPEGVAETKQEEIMAYDKERLTAVDDPSLKTLPDEDAAKETARFYRYLTKRPAGPGAIPAEHLVTIDPHPADALNPDGEAVYYAKQLPASVAAKYALTPDYTYFANKSVHLEIYQRKEGGAPQTDAPRFFEQDYEKTYEENFVRTDSSSQVVCAKAVDKVTSEGSIPRPLREGDIIEVDGQLWNLDKSGFSRVELHPYGNDYAMAPLTSETVKALIEEAKKNINEESYAVYRQKFRESSYIGAQSDATLAVHPGVFQPTDSEKEGAALAMQRLYAEDYRERTRQEGLSIYTPADEKGWKKLDEEFAASFLMDAFAGKFHQDDAISKGLQAGEDGMLYYMRLAEYAIQENSPYSVISQDKQYGEICVIDAAKRQDVDAAYRAYKDGKRADDAQQVARPEQEAEEGRSR